MPQGKSAKVSAYINHRMRITNTDTRTIIGAGGGVGGFSGRGACRMGLPGPRAGMVAVAEMLPSPGAHRVAAPPTRRHADGV